MRWLKNLKFNNVFYPYYTESLNIKVENNLRPEKKNLFCAHKTYAQNFQLKAEKFNWKKYDLKNCWTTTKFMDSLKQKVTREMLEAVFQNFQII